ncbi:MAG: hypothetical protein ACK56G_12210 [Pirellulaceae bacterium]
MTYSAYLPFPKSIENSIWQRLFPATLASLFGLLLSATGWGQEAVMLPLEDAAIDRSRLIWSLEEPAASVWRIPRLYNGIRSVSWNDGKGKTALQVQPELDHWLLKLDAPASGGKIELELDGTPAIDAANATHQADGSFWLAASQGRCEGRLLRYEPQPHKNTIGYWADAKDRVFWTIDLKQPGKFSVAILQGCGQGQGGSRMKMSIGPADGDSTNQATRMLPFVVEETGHFQNFQWRHIGLWEPTTEGTYRLEMAVEQMAKGAAMDVRAVHLIRLP